MKETVVETAASQQIKDCKRKKLGNALVLPIDAASCNYLDGLERADVQINKRVYPQLIITSPTSENIDDYESDNSPQVKKCIAHNSLSTEGCTLRLLFYID